MQRAISEGKEVARVHSGDPSLYGAIAEQIRRLKALGIPYDVTPGVPAFAAAAAALGRELTMPEVSQTVILTRTAMKSSAMPEGEDLATLARTGATLVIHLSIRNLLEVERQLAPLYGADCPVIVAYRVGWPDETFIHGTLADIRDKVRAAKITRTALVLGRPRAGGFRFSRLGALRCGARARAAAEAKAVARMKRRLRSHRRSLASGYARSITCANEPMTRPRRRPIGPSG